MFVDNGVHDSFLTRWVINITTGILSTVLAENNDLIIVLGRQGVKLPENRYRWRQCTQHVSVAQRLVALYIDT